MQGFTLSFTVLRLLTSLKMYYEVAKRRAAPVYHDRRSTPADEHETVKLVRRLSAKALPGYTLVNNRCEGNAPLTIQTLTEMLSK